MTPAPDVTINTTSNTDTSPTSDNRAPASNTAPTQAVSEIMAETLAQLQAHTGRDFSHYQTVTPASIAYGMDFWQAIAEVVAEVQHCRARDAQLQFQADVLQQISEAVIAIDQNERITYLNAAAAAQYEVDPVAALGQPLQYLHQYEWLQPDDDLIAYSALAEHGCWRGENRHSKRNGAVLYVESTVSLLRDPAGHEIGLLACIRDITARKQAEAALQATEHRYRQLADAMPHLVWTANAAGVVDYYNMRIHDYDPAVWQGAYGFDWQRLLHPDDLAPTLATWQKAALHKESYTFEHRLRMADGSWRWHLSRAVLARGVDNVDKWYGTATDIHERKQAEETLNFHASLLDYAYDAVIATDTEYNITAWNWGAAAMYGWSADEVRGRKAYEVTQSSLTPDARAVAVRQMAERGHFQVEVTTRHRDGTPILVEGHTAAMRDATGQITGYMSISRDIRERRVAEQALWQSEERYRTLFETMDEGFCVFEMIFDEANRPLDYRFLEMNPAFANFTGLVDAVGKTARELVPNLEAHWFEIYGQVARTGEARRFVEGSDAMGRWFDVYAFRFGEPANHHVALLFTDMTARKAAEDALRASEAMARRHLAELEAIYKTAPVGLCVMDKELRYVRINERLAAMNGYPADYHIGRTGRELFPDLALKSEDALRRILATGEAVAAIELTGELPMQPGVQHTWRQSWFPLHNEADEVVAINIVIEEITDQKQAEVALHTSAERLHLATEAGGIGIFDHDLLTNQTEISAIYARITGFPPDAVVTREAWLDCVHPEDRALVAAVWEQCQATGASYHYACRLVRPDRTLVWIEVNAWVTQDETGRGVRITGAIQDITEQKQAALHQQFLLDLNATMRKLSDPAAIQQTVVKRLGEYLGVSHCRFNAIDLAADHATLLAAWSASGGTAGSNVNPLSAYASPAYIADAQAGRTLVVHNTVLDERPANTQRLLLEHRMQAMLRVPCLSEGQWVASLHVLQNTPRTWRTDEVQLVESVVYHFWPLVEKARAEEALRTSERRFRQLADTMPQVVWTCQADGAITYINGQWSTYSGMTLTDTLQQGMWPALHPADLATNRAQWQRALERGEPYEGEVRMRRHDGVYRWFLERALPVRNETGDIQQWFGVSMDITDRKATEEALAARAAELRVITDNIRGFISYVDREHRYQFVNAAYEELYGQPRDQIAGQSLRTLLGDAVYAQVQPYMVRALQGETLQFEATLAYATGTRTIWATYVPDIDPQGVVQGFYALVTDISERKAVEEALRQSEETARQRLAELEAIYDTAPIGLCILDRDLRWVRINERLAEINGFPAMAHLGRSVRELLPGLAPAAEPIFHRIMESNQPVLNLELQGQTPAQPGVERTWLEHWFPLHDHSGAVIGINVVAEEITERKRQERELQELNATLEARVLERTAALEQANQELARSNRELEQFNYAAAHDLKSPLRGIHHLVQWISEDAAAVLPPVSQKHLRLLHGRVQRLETLLDDMLAYSQIGRVHYVPEAVDINLLVQNLIDLLAPPPGFTITLPAPLPTLVTMRTPLETVLRNLLSNTIKHHHQPDRGYVEVTARALDAWVEFTIQDNGPGIDPIFHERIFDMFQTLQPRDQVEGSGVGLALVKKTLESYGGQIRVDSAKGAGTTFHFTWPT